MGADMERYDVVIVGAGIAGLSAARTAREIDSSVSILLVNEEDRLPYKRTKVSKHLAAGFKRDEFRLEPMEWYSANRVGITHGRRAVRINRDDKRLALDDGAELEYKKLILAVGSEPLYPRAVREHERGSFHRLRTAADAETLRKAADNAGSVVIVGMGVLSVELAEQFRKMKKSVTLIGATAQLLPRRLNLRASELMEELLRKNKVDLSFHEEVLSFEPDGKGKTLVTMIKKSGRFDMVVFCIGVAPRIALAREAGIDVSTGVIVDEYLTTSDRDILAAGDCAQHPGGHVSYLWHAAEHQGHVAGANAVGRATKFLNPPFRMKCEIFGTQFLSVDQTWPGDRAEALTVREAEAGGKYVAGNFSDGRLVSVVAVNDTDRSALYQSAVRERWPEARCTEELLSPIR